MRALITGASASGKSKIAEDLAISLSPVRLYLATMQAYGEEGANRIARHRKMREGKGFLTIERSCGLDSLDLSDPSCFAKNVSGEDEVLPDDVRFFKNAHDGSIECVVLLECLGNLVASEMFLEDGSCLSAKEAFDRVERGIASLERQCSHIVVVGNDVGSSSGGYDASTLEYIKCIGMVSCSLASRYDVVAEVASGIPCVAKGRLP